MLTSFIFISFETLQFHSFSRISLQIDIPEFCMGLFFNYPTIWGCFALKTSDGPAHFRVIYTGASNANCTKHHLFGHSKRPATLFREGAKCFISGARMQGRVAFFPPAFTRAHSSANFQQGQTWRTIVASVIPPTTFAVAPIIAHTKEATHIDSSLKEKLFRLSGWGTPYRRAPGRFECPNQARKPCKRVPPLLEQLST